MNKLKVTFIDLAKALMELYNIDFDEACSMIMSNIEISISIINASNIVLEYVEVLS